MNTPENGRAEILPGNTYLLDTLYLGRERFAAAYFIEDNGEIAIIETNTNHAVPRILSAVKDAGFPLKNIKYVILTHIHLDHAGGAGLMMDHLPDAELVVHPRGARHMVSPGALIESVKQVYGEDEYKRLYGEILGVPEERVVGMTGGESLTLGNRELQMIESPGHARHHNVVYDKSYGSVFSGDAFGIGYPRFRYPRGELVFPSTSPVQFDPAAAVRTIEMIAGLNPSRVLLTHYGSIENIREVREQLIGMVGFTEKRALQRFAQGLKGDELDQALTGDIWEMFEGRMIEIRGTGLTADEKEHLFFDADLNGKGAAFYITRKNKV